MGMTTGAPQQSRSEQGNGSIFFGRHDVLRLTWVPSISAPGTFQKGEAKQKDARNGEVAVGGGAGTRRVWVRRLNAMALPTPQSFSRTPAISWYSARVAPPRNLFPRKLRFSVSAVLYGRDVLRFAPSHLRRHSSHRATLASASAFELRPPAAAISAALCRRNPLLSSSTQPSPP